MKNIKEFSDFLNEDYNQLNEGYWGDYKGIVTKVYTKASNDGYEPLGDWDNLAYTLRSLKFDPKITMAKLVKDPKFKKLPQTYQDDIMRVVGAKGKNKKYIKDFISAASNSFGNGIMIGRHDDLERAIYAAASYKRNMDDKDYDSMISDVYDGMSNQEKKVLRAKYGSFYDITKTLTPEEIEHIIKYTKSNLIGFVSKYFNDRRISNWISEELKSRFSTSGYGEHGEPYYFASTDWTQNAMKKPLDFVKTLITKGDRIKWDDFEVDRKMLGSENSTVVSSSFSTTYYYKVKLKINGKTFNLPKVDGGSTYFSGGWN